MESLDRPITSRDGFQDAIKVAFEKITIAGCREIFLCDDHFADWPFNDPALLALLAEWSQPQRRCHVLARSFDGFVRLHPRWVVWRRQWSHLVQCRSVEQFEPGACPSLLLAPGVVALRLSDPLRYRGRMSTQAADIQRVRELFDAVSQHSADAFPATTLGL